MVRRVELHCRSLNGLMSMAMRPHELDWDSFWTLEFPPLFLSLYSYISTLFVISSVVTAFDVLGVNIELDRLHTLVVS